MSHTKLIRIDYSKVNNLLNDILDASKKGFHGKVVFNVKEIREEIDRCSLDNNNIGG